MKFITILSLILLSCSKENPDTPESKCMAATFYIDSYSDYTFRQRTGTRVAIHFCKVCDDLLDSYRRLDSNAILCSGRPERQRIVLGVDTCIKNK